MTGNPGFNEFGLRDGFCWVLWCLGDPRSAVAEKGLVGVSVRNLTSSLDITALGSNDIRPAPLKPPLILLSVIAVKSAVLKAIKNSTLVIWLICALTKCS